MDSLTAYRQSLAEALRTRSLIPVIGPEMLQVQAPDTDRPQPFYQLVADELLKAYGCTLPELPGEPGWQLHRAVLQILRGGASTARVRRSVAVTVREVAARVEPSATLKRLAALDTFDLFICLTPDDLLVKALGARSGGPNLSINAYAPSGDSSRTVDVAAATPGATRVFFPLGRAEAGDTAPAIHEEDTLEYLFKFQEEAPRRAPRLLSELRCRDLLLLGCNLPDGLGRNFIRLANENRLSSQDKKMEFFAADARDAPLNAFLARYNPNACVFPWTPDEFVAELEALAPRLPPERSPVIVPPPPRPAHGPTAFISYASEDAEAARQLADALLAAGCSEAWLDRRKLVAGDDWSDRIEAAIDHCDYFVPILSQQADRRREGVFWEEWRRAAARALRINDNFLLPVGVDDEHPLRCAYERIFYGFTSDFSHLHLIHAPRGSLTDASRNDLKGCISRFGAAPGPGGEHG